MLYAANMCSPFTSCRPHRINWHFCVVFNWSTKRILLVLIWTFFRAMRNEMILTKTRHWSHTLLYITGWCHRHTKKPTFLPSINIPSTSSNWSTINISTCQHINKLWGTICLHKRKTHKFYPIFCYCFLIVNFILQSTFRRFSHYWGRYAQWKFIL